MKWTHQPFDRLRASRSKACQIALAGYQRNRYKSAQKLGNSGGTALCTRGPENADFWAYFYNF